mmetsp:Transcript_51745/g.155294  ORF Transcript_51745/g.155294 Transcript_51745/m.155294 type:complete len:204 (-) Transcript_51745:130-741(-)
MPPPLTSNTSTVDSTACSSRCESGGTPTGWNNAAKARWRNGAFDTLRNAAARQINDALAGVGSIFEAEWSVAAMSSTSPSLPSSCAGRSSASQTRSTKTDSASTDSRFRRRVLRSDGRSGSELEESPPSTERAARGRISRRTYAERKFSTTCSLSDVRPACSTPPNNCNSTSTFVRVILSLSLSIRPCSSSDGAVRFLLLSDL